MHCINIIFGFVAAVSAIDITLHEGRGCGGEYWQCKNRNPNDCCTVYFPASFGSIGFWGIPTDWSLNLRGHDGGECANLKTSLNVFGENFKCLDEGYYTGGGYSFNFGKRTAQPAPAEQSCYRPDELVLKDGKKFSLAGLADDQFEELVGLVRNETVQGDIPKFFQEVNIQRCGNMHGCS